MIFVLAANEPALFVMLAESDVADMRKGLTKFADRRQIGDHTFNKITLSLHKSDTEALKCVRQAGHAVPELKAPGPDPGETACKECGGLMATPSLFEGVCVCCWASIAKRLGAKVN